MNVTSEKAETGLAGRYATALFELARDQGAVDTVSADLTTLKRAIHESPDLARLVKSPIFGAEEQAGALAPVLALIGLSPLSTKFVRTVTHKRRLFALEAIIAAYERLVARSRGEMEAEVTAARPLNDGEVAELKSVLKARLGREPRLNSRVDPALLGGLVVKVGSRMIDTSLRTKLDGLRAAMKGN
ncbi:MAG: ATP synthase F1 subunit delta [Alphaproteobacteria bacterium 64-11]|nr:F0F1 ATP synthase subunit delta [Alphaproteobacteria bacterium]OJU14219.1 MAG: ATP synthase F1 subunit delta [Alphaproteobacteria bacterium 64-11]